MSDRLPFVSGLPGPGLDRPRAPILSTTLRLLLPARDLLIDQIEELGPQCLSRFDGVERIPADEQAIAKRACLETNLAVLEAIIADESLQDVMAQWLARRRQR